MKIAKLSATQVDHLDQALAHAEVHSLELLIGFDETDQSIKWKVGQYAWSPPIRTEER